MTQRSSNGRTSEDFKPSHWAKMQSFKVALRCSGNAATTSGVNLSPYFFPGPAPFAGNTRNAIQGCIPANLAYRMKTKLKYTAETGPLHIPAVTRVNTFFPRNSAATTPSKVFAASSLLLLLLVCISLGRNGTAQCFLPVVTDKAINSVNVGAERTGRTLTINVIQLNRVLGIMRYPLFPIAASRRLKANFSSEGHAFPTEKHVMYCHFHLFG